MASSPLKTKLKTTPYRYADAHRLASELGVSMTLASVLTRRGYASAREAREFLRGGDLIEPDLLNYVDAASSVIEAAIDTGEKITVHGDYDADGVCSTSIAVRSLKRLGANVNWFIPSRFDDGYGVSVSNVERLSDRGAGLIIAVDCGISDVDAVDRAKQLGMRFVICDHHKWDDRLPDCPVVHPHLGDYPFRELCATAVTYKLMQRLFSRRDRDAKELEDELELVALATVADMVPLIGENRDLARRGLSRISFTNRTGLLALLETSGLDKDSISSQDVSFRLAPRLNAVGRLYRADAGVELMLTEDDSRAREIARELESANRERRDIEHVVHGQAESERSQIIKSGADPPAFVLAGRGWHQGVVGIVASRMVRRYHRPCVLISLPEESGTDVGKGSGRSIPGFDLHAALTASSRHLVRFGGHSMAAGLEIEPDMVDAFRDLLVSHAREKLNPGDLIPVQRIDAVVPGDLLGLDLAEELRLMEPFGQGNDGINLLVPAATVDDVKPIGNGDHVKFSVTSAGSRSEGVAFGCGGSLPLEANAAHDVAFNLEINRWNGSVEPQIILKGLSPVLAVSDSSGCRNCECRASGDEWWRLACEGYDTQPDLGTPGESVARCRNIVDSRGSGPLGVVGELASTGESVVVLSADVSRRKSAITGQFDARRLGAGESALATKRCAPAAVERLLNREPNDGLVAFIDHEVAEGSPEVLELFEHIVMLDPPYNESRLNAILCTGSSLSGNGFAHLLWGADEVRFTERVVEQELGLRAPIDAIYRCLVDSERKERAGSLEVAELMLLTEGSGSHPRAPRLIGRCLRVLSELGMIKVTSDGFVATSTLNENAPTAPDLERSKTFEMYGKLYQESSRFLKVALISKWG